jgi:hypothetical protein
MVQALSLSIERGEVFFPDIPELIQELSLYGYEMLSTGGVRYSAPEGHHDDCVMALALANFRMRHHVSWEDFPQIESPLLEGHRIGGKFE